jgi:2'-5' RNA ligase
VRLFVAAKVPREVLDRLVRAQRELGGRTGSSVRWVRPEGIHLTLKFLGEVEEEAAGRIGETLGAIGSSGFPVACRGIGFFPNRSRPRIVWAGLEEPSGRLGELHREVEQRLEPLGFARESRPFHPHLTLGRSRSQRGERRLVEAADPLAGEAFGEFSVSEIHLFQSRLLPDGARYTVLETVPLTGEGC